MQIRILEILKMSRRTPKHDVEIHLITSSKIRQSIHVKVNLTGNSGRVPIENFFNPHIYNQRTLNLNARQELARPS